MPSTDAAVVGSPRFAPLVAVAAVALGQAVLVFGRRPLALISISVALLAVSLAVFVRGGRPPRLRIGGVRAAIVVIGVGLLAQLIALATSSPALYAKPVAARLLVAAGATAAVVIVAELAGIARFARVRLPILAAIQLALGIWIIRASPAPPIDVYTFHLEALRALGQGLDPYGRTIPNIYGHESFYGPGLVVNGRVQLGFPYPPLSLLMAGVGQVVAGDFRFAGAAAMALAALLIGTCRPGRLAVGAAALFLFMPRGLFVLEQGWTEPYVVLLLAATVWCACRAPALVPLALGLLLAVKQYMILAAPLVVLLHAGPAPWRKAGRTLLQAAAVAAVVTLPFVVAGPAAFVRDVVMFQLYQPFRGDSLSYLAEWAHLTGRVPPSSWPGLLAVPVVVALCLWRAPRGPAGFAAAVALTSLVLFAFSKQAFVNYYYFVIGALCCALAATPPQAEDPAANR